MDCRRFGIRTCALERPFRADGLRMLHDRGFSAAELSFNRPVSQLNWSDRVLGKDIEKAASRLSVRLSAHAPDGMGLALPDADEAMRNARSLLRMVDSAPSFGVRDIVIHPDTADSGAPSQDELRLDNLVEAIERILPACEKNAVRLLLEILPPPCLSSSPERLARAHDRLRSRHVAICLDTNHLNLPEDLTSAILGLGGRIGEFHFNDKRDVKEEHLLPFDGRIDWDGLAKATEAIGFEGSFILEPSHFDPARHKSLLDAATAALPELKRRFLLHHKPCGGQNERMGQCRAD